MAYLGVGIKQERIKRYMKHNHRYEYGRIILSPLEAEDIEELRIIRNKERSFFQTKEEISADSQKKWYESYLKKDDDIMFKISHRDAPDDFIGAIAVYDIDWINKTAEVGRTVLDKSKNSEPGLGQDATKGICLFTFTVLGIDKIVASILKSNERILKVDTRTGFYITGDYSDDSYAIEMTKTSLNW